VGLAGDGLTVFGLEMRVLVVTAGFEAALVTRLVLLDLAGLDVRLLPLLPVLALRAPVVEDAALAFVRVLAAAPTTFLADAFAFGPTLGFEAFLCVFLDIRLPFVAFDRSILQEARQGGEITSNHVLAAGQTRLARDMVTGIRLYCPALHACTACTDFNRFNEDWQ
jgi:hypothetical protein